MSRLALDALCTAAVLLPAAASQAVVVPTASRPLFESALSGVTTVTFDGVPDVNYTPAQALAGVDFGPFTVVASPNPANADLSVNTEQLGLFLFTSGAGVPHANLFTFTFDAPITGFGADFLGVDANADGITIDGQTFALTTLLGDRFGFGGFTSTTPFTTVSFANIPPARVDLFFLDNITFGGAAAPEPATAGLLGLAAAGLLFRRRRA